MGQCYIRATAARMIAFYSFLLMHVYSFCLVICAQFLIELVCLTKYSQLGRHPNINAFLGLYENKKYYMIVLEYMKGGELLDILIRRVESGQLNYTEAQVAVILRYDYRVLVSLYLAALSLLKLENCTRVFSAHAGHAVRQAKSCSVRRCPTLAHTRTYT